MVRTPSCKQPRNPGAKRYQIWYLACLSTSLLILLAGCDRGTRPSTSDSGLQSARSQDARERQVLARHWDTLSTVGGSIDDTTVINGNELFLRRDTLIVADFGGRRLVAYDTAGQLLWTFGRGGSGPGEFRQITDVSIGGDGRILVLDAINRRITSFSPWQGTFTEAALRDIGRPSQLIGLRKGVYLISTMASPDTAFVLVDSTGNVLQRATHAWPGLSKVHPMAAQLWLTRGPTGVWVAAFSLASGFVAYDSVLTPLVKGDYVDPVEFPSVKVTRDGDSEVQEFVGSAGCTACSIATDSGTLFIVAGTDPDHRSRWVDAYGLADGTYHGSYLLPEPARAIATKNDTFYVLRNEPAPGILVIRPQP